ncbi:dihydrolipoyl dehydrogenase [Collibacillus ludicampi]|uniref:Dihydrolipoyl dehydrogenase n=1 Tax=Collibacillus ludicampi TaxID=2771369 RepID=A0AAV4LK98_9BACL|nr:dihydrolipoyl dehydrogenase [Collibacillus ludicampi]GIM48314.1 dihydrolipoyl dehydrogenase [Collibacillus ludicampi]
MAEQYDIVVIGGGTGGYVAAIRAAQLGLKVALVERDKVGGTCLHRGCIPSKALLKSAELYNTMKKSEEFGIMAPDVKLDFSKVMERKSKIVGQLHKGVQHLLKQNKVDVIQGTGRVMGPSIFSPRAGAVRVEKENGETEILNPGHVIIATGSRPKTLPGLHIDGRAVITSDEALELSEIPKSVIIIGAGAIGVEWASMLADFGTEVTLVEYMPQILPLEDEDVAAELERNFKKRKIKLMTGTKVLPETLEHRDGHVAISVERNGQTEALAAEKILVAVGREAIVDDIGLEATEVEVERGFIKVDPYYRTKEANIFAIGDVIGGLQLAHVASHEGIIAVETIAGKNPHPLDYTQVPKCTYSRPEVASVGLTEKEAREKGIDVKVGKFPFRAIGKALVNGEVDGFVKMVANAQTNDLIGVHMIGSHVTDLISEAGLAKLLDATPWEVGIAIHPHPTLSEAIGEAALAVDGIAIHYA